MKQHTDVGEQDIRDQLGRVLASSEFRAESLKRFLSFVVDETLAGRAHQIKAYTVAVQAFERPSDFDPQSDTIVRVQARRLRRALRYYYGTEGVHDPILIEIPRGTYVPVFSRRVTEADEAPKKPALEMTLPAAGPVQRTRGPSIAVVPFDTLVDDPEQLYLANGLTHALAVALSSHSEFRIIGPLSRRRLREEGRGPRSIGRDYGADFVLGGHLRRQGNRLRLTITLAEAGSGRSLWADGFDCQDIVSDLFVFEDAVVSQVTAAVADHYGVIHRALVQQAVEKRTEHVEVYDAILRYYHYTVTYPIEERAPTLAALERAAQIDPKNALVLSLLAGMHVVDFMIGGEAASLDLGGVLVERAIGLDPQCGNAFFVRACFHFLHGRREPCIQDIEMALQYSPYQPDTVMLSGTLLFMMGHRDRGAALVKEALRLNPHLPWNHRTVTFMSSYRQRRYDAALAEALSMHAPGFFLQPLCRAAALGQLGRGEDAASALQELLELRPDFPSRAEDLIRRWMFSDENAEMLLDGLRKAGLEDYSGNG